MRAMVLAITSAVCAGSSAAQCEVGAFTNDGEANADQFGADVAVDGDTALISDWFWEDDGTGDGRVYVYRRNGVDWQLEDVLSQFTPADEAFSTMFGESVALDGDRALVGAPGLDLTEERGIVYFFVRDAQGWSLEQALMASDGAPYDWFGSDVALDGDSALVSNGSGQVYALRRNNGTWAEEQILAGSWGFDASVALAGGVAIVGDPGDSDGGNSSGAAHVYRRSGSSWSFETKLTASDAEPFRHLAASVDFDGTRAILGAGGDDHAGFSAGSAYVFRDTGAGWVEETKLIAASPDANDHFGDAVAIAGERAVVGAWLADETGLYRGAAYVFERSGTSWTPAQLLAPPSVHHPDQYLGNAVATDGVSAWIGAWVPSHGTGYTYAWAIGGDCNGSGAPDACDVLAGTSNDFDENGTPDECQPLSVDVEALSVAAGGSQSMTLDAGAAHALEPYLVLGTTAGTAPGFSFDGVAIPLNPSVYGIHTLTHPNQAPLAASLGTLDANGAASASFGLPAGAGSALVGLQAHHAFVLFPGGDVTYASNAMPLALEP